MYSFNIFPAEAAAEQKNNRKNRFPLLSKGIHEGTRRNKMHSKMRQSNVAAADGSNKTQREVVEKIA